MKIFNRLRLASLLGAVLLVSACGGDSDEVASPTSPTSPAPPIATLPSPGPPVPGNTGAGVSSFIAYLTGLSMTDETSEASPIANGFAVPDDETSDPQLLS